MGARFLKYFSLSVNWNPLHKFQFAAVLTSPANKAFRGLSMNFIHFAKLLTGVMVTVLATACGGDAREPGPSAPFSVSAGNTQSGIGGERVQLQATWTNETSTPSIFWTQISGPPVTFIDDQQTMLANPVLVLPSVQTSSEIVMQAIAEDSVNRVTSEVSLFVHGCNASNGSLFENCLGAGFGPFTAFESSTEHGSVFQFQGDGDHHVHWQITDTGDAEHQQVIEVTWNANDPSHEEDGKGWFGIAVNNGDLSAYASGSISFDTRLVYHEQHNNAAPFIVKMECGYPCLSDEFIIPDAAQSYEWKTHTYPISQFMNTGLDIQNVSYAFVVQPDWFQQEQTVTVQFDNIRLNPTYEPPGHDPSCPARGNVSYNLARVANPSADQQEAYRLITAAMDEAVRNYNCYTNLARNLNVSYNPGVATADGSTNGSIRFGSRASMHYVTAMHEIAHTFGVGFDRFRALVVNGVYTGPEATAQLRAISGIANDEIHSDGTHFWPHGLNYISEGGTQQDLINHCLVVEAMVRDIN